MALVHCPSMRGHSLSSRPHPSHSVPHIEGLHIHVPSSLCVNISVIPCTCVSSLSPYVSLAPFVVGRVDWLFVRLVIGKLGYL